VTTRAFPAALGAALLCAIAWRRHKPERQPIGGFRCSECGKAGAGFDDFGLDGYVKPLRTSFSREHGGTVTRSDRSTT
jgi:hypothetical protein